MIATTIRNSVKMAALDGEWQQKKNSGRLRDNQKKELAPAERELASLQEQAEEIRESREYADIDAKLKSGQKLTPDEIAYLKKNNPQALKEYEEIQEQRKAYKEALKNCRSKEEVERLKVTKMGQFMAQAKEISHNPNIPKGQKKAMLEKLVRIIAGVQKEHLDFEKSLQYQMLPEKDEDKDKGRRSETEEIPGEEQALSEAQPKEDADEMQEPVSQGRADRETVSHRISGEETASQQMPAGRLVSRQTPSESSPGKRTGDTGILVDICL